MLVLLRLAFRIECKFPVLSLNTYRVRETFNLLRTFSTATMRGEKEVSKNNPEQSKFPTMVRYSEDSVEMMETEKDWERLVDIESLCSEHLKIHMSHAQALKEGSSFYQDPKTGFSVMTRLCHIKRENCCGSACRHCPYGHAKVHPRNRNKKFNSAFYV